MKRNQTRNVKQVIVQQCHIKFDFAYLQELGQHSSRDGLILPYTCPQNDPRRWSWCASHKQCSVSAATAFSCNQCLVIFILHWIKYGRKMCLKATGEKISTGYNHSQARHSFGNIASASIRSFLLTKLRFCFMPLTQRRNW